MMDATSHTRHRVNRPVQTYELKSNRSDRDNSLNTVLSDQRQKDEGDIYASTASVGSPEGTSEHRSQVRPNTPVSRMYLA